MTGQEDDRELEALGLVDGQDGDGVGVGIELGRGRVVAGLDQRREVRARRRSPGRRRAAPTGPGRSRRSGRCCRGPPRPRRCRSRPGGPAGRCRAGIRRAARRPVARGRSPRSRGGPRPAWWTVARVSGPTRRMPGWRSSSSRIAQTERFRRRAMLTIAVRSSPPSPYTSEVASAYRSTLDSGSATTRRKASSSRTSGRA